MDMATLTDALRRLTEGETVIDPTIVTQVMRLARHPSRVSELPTQAGSAVPRRVKKDLSNQEAMRRTPCHNEPPSRPTPRGFS